MAEIIKMPRLSDTMEEGNIVKWYKNVGDKINPGDVLADIETDKATMEVDTFATGIKGGYLLHIGVASGTIPVDGLLAIVGNQGEDISALLNGGAPAAAVAVAEPVAVAPVVVAAPVAVATTIPASVHIIRMPRLSDTMEEGNVVKWHKNIGDEIKAGDILADVETDKATMELDTFAAGIKGGFLLHKGIESGPIAVDELLAIIGNKGDDILGVLNGGSVAPAAVVAPVAVVETVAAPSAAASSSSSSDNDSRVKASPLARVKAKDKGINLTQVQGSGPNGRVIERDINEYKSSASAPSSSTVSAPAAPKVATAPIASIAGDTYEDFPASQMRKVIAKRLGESKFSAPEFYLTVEINMDKSIEARTSLNEIAPVKISFNDFVIKAVAASLRQHPVINSSWTGDAIRRHHQINIGVAVAVEDGLLVPVVRNADNKSLSQINTEVKSLAGKAKEKKISPDEMSGSTFTISNLGMFDIEEFTSIINMPNACILAVGAIIKKPIVKDDAIVIGNMMRITLTCDHRVVDGATGAKFLQTLRGILEDPIRLLV